MGTIRKGTGPFAGSPGANPVTAISSAAKRWSGLWGDLDASRVTVLARADTVRANQRGLRLELVPMLLDDHHGRRFISIGIQYDTGPESYRVLGSPALGQFVNLPFSDWAIADQLWGLLEVGDFGVSFRDLDVIDGDFDRKSRASDHAEKAKWIQRVWELKLRVEENAKSHTWAALTRVAGEIRARLGADAASPRGTELPASVLAPAFSEEALTRFRINQGMYGDHSYFIDRPVAGRMMVRPIPVEPMFQRASELQKELTDEWLTVLGETLDELSAITAGKEGAAFARAIESADVARKLNLIVGTFWTMWQSPVFSPNADFEVVTDHQRRAEKYMEVMVQRTFRILIKQAVEGLGQYPYPDLDRFNYGKKIRCLKEAVNRARRVLDLYASARTLPALRRANGVRHTLIREFQNEIVAM